LAHAVRAVTLPAMPLRDEQTGDHDAVGAVHQTAFGGEHGSIVARLVDALRRDDPGALSLVFEEAGHVVGHILFSRALLDTARELVAVQTLSPLAVAPQWQGRGIGSALIRAGLQQLGERGVPLVFLEGDPRFYSRVGFGPAVHQGFRKPSLRIPDRAFQVVKLSAYEPWMTGTFVYPNTFWEHDCVGVRATPQDEVGVSSDAR
jgi:putative acetyltransferase